LLGRRIGIGIDLAGLKSQQRRGAVFERQDDLAVDLHVCGIMKILVLDENCAIIWKIVGEPKGAVADEIAGAGEVVAKARDISLLDRHRRLMRQKPDKVRRRRGERDLEPRRVDGANAEPLPADFAAIDLPGVDDRIEQVGVLRAGRWVQKTAERKDEIIRADCIAIRPSRLAQFENVAQAILADRPTFGDAGDNPARRVVGDETFEEVAEKIGFGDAGGLLRIECCNVACRAAPIDHLRPRRAGDAKRCGKH
jgi:hypothetical protein